MRQAYDDTSPCTRCGSSMEDCDCCAEYELRSSMESLGLRTEQPSSMSLDSAYWLAKTDYDLATLNRMLREFGY